MIARCSLAVTSTPTMLKAMLSCSCNHNVVPACITADRHEGEPGVSYDNLEVHETGKWACDLRDTQLYETRRG